MEMVNITIDGIKPGFPKNSQYLKLQNHWTSIYLPFAISKGLMKSGPAGSVSLR